MGPVTVFERPILVLATVPYRKMPNNCAHSPIAFSVQSGALRLSGLDVRTTMCCTSLHVSAGLASSARAMRAAAMGALALVPVCFTVQPWWRSVVTICLSDVVPEL